MNKSQHAEFIQNIDQMADSLMVLEYEIDDPALKKTVSKLIVNFFHIRQLFVSVKSSDRL